MMQSPHSHSHSLMLCAHFVKKREKEAVKLLQSTTLFSIRGHNFANTINDSFGCYFLLKIFLNTLPTLQP